MRDLDPTFETGFFMPMRTFIGSVVWDIRAEDLRRASRFNMIVDGRREQKGREGKGMEWSERGKFAVASLSQHIFSPPPLAFTLQSEAC